jgi:hypothetical protein
VLRRTRFRKVGEIIDDAGITALQDAIRHLYGLESTWLETVPVHEVFQGQTVWQGEVEVFAVDHPGALRRPLEPRTRRHTVAFLMVSAFECVEMQRLLLAINRSFLGMQRPSLAMLHAFAATLRRRRRRSRRGACRAVLPPQPRRSGWQPIVVSLGG